MSSSAVVETARDYYNSEDADRFYASVWGGEDIHVGIYERDDEPIADASRRTVERMLDKLGSMSADDRVLDAGSGYGGAARVLARRLGCRVVGLNLSEVENRRARELNAAAGLGDRIEITDGSFESIPDADRSFAAVWSQDAILHSGDRRAVIAEIARVLRPGGVLVFTDPMQADDCPKGVLGPILDRIHLTDLGSPGFYREACGAVGLVDFEIEDLTEQLVTHYSRVLAETEARAEELATEISGGYLERMCAGLQRWIDGGRAGHLAWGIMRARKP